MKFTAKVTSTKYTDDGQRVNPIITTVYKGTFSMTGSKLGKFTAWETIVQTPGMDAKDLLTTFRVRTSRVITGGEYSAIHAACQKA